MTKKTNKTLNTIIIYINTTVSTSNVFYVTNINASLGKIITIRVKYNLRRNNIIITKNIIVKIYLITPRKSNAKILYRSHIHF